MYKTTTGGTINAGSYVITMSGVEFSTNVDILDELVGVSLTRTEDTPPVLIDEPVVVEEPVVTE